MTASISTYSISEHPDFRYGMSPSRDIFEGEENESDGLPSSNNEEDGLQSPQNGERVQEQSPKMSLWRWVTVSGAVLLATVLLALDNTVVADLQPQIVGALGETSKFPWISVTFSLGAVGSSLSWSVIPCSANGVILTRGQGQALQAF